MQISDLEEEMQILVGKEVLAKTIAGNSINLWFIAEPKSKEARRVWLDPPWRIETDQGIESSSYGFPSYKEDGETEGQYRSRFDSSCARSDCLKGAKLLSLSIDQFNSDLVLTFDNGRVVRTFSVDIEYENWHFNDYANRTRYGVHINQIDVEGHDA